MEALYCYNVTLKDNATALTAPVNAIYNYHIWIKGIDTAPPLGHVDSGPFNVGDTVWVKSPHGRCLTQFKRGMVTGIYSPHSVLINGIPRHTRDLHPRHRSTAVIVYLKVTRAWRCFMLQNQVILYRTRGSRDRQWWCWERERPTEHSYRRISSNFM